MKHIKVLGAGCASCKTTVEMIQRMAQQKGVTVDVEKVEDLQQIMAYGVMSTPAIVINEKVIHAGGMPTKNEIEQWLKYED